MVAAPLGIVAVRLAVDRPQWVVSVLAGFIVAESLATVSGFSPHKLMTPVVLVGLVVQYGRKRISPPGLDALDALVLPWVVNNAALIPSALESSAATHSVQRTTNVAIFYVLVSRLFVKRYWRDRLAFAFVGFAVVLVIDGLRRFCIATLDANADEEAATATEAVSTGEASGPPDPELRRALLEAVDRAIVTADQVLADRARPQARHRRDAVRVREHAVVLARQQPTRARGLARRRGYGPTQAEASPDSKPSSKTSSALGTSRRA